MSDERLEALVTELSGSEAEARAYIEEVKGRGKKPLRVVIGSNYGVEILRYMETKTFWVLFVADDHIQIAGEIVRLYFPEHPEGLYEATIIPQLRAVLLFCSKTRMSAEALSKILNTPPFSCPSATAEALSAQGVIILATPAHTRHIYQAVAPMLEVAEKTKR